MIDVNKIRFLMVGPITTPEATLRNAVADVIRACEASGVANGERMIVLNAAWQRLAQERRAVAWREGTFELELETQRDHLRRLDPLLADDSPERYEIGEGGRVVWRGYTEAVIEVMSDPSLPNREDVTATHNAA